MKIRKIESYSVVYVEPVTVFLYQLTETLLRENYFSFLDSALNYVSNIQNFIENNINTVSSHPAPSYFSKYKSGMKYISYQANKRTTWYIFFKQFENRFLIYYITNNHFEGQFLKDEKL